MEPTGISAWKLWDSKSSLASGNRLRWEPSCQERAVGFTELGKGCSRCLSEAVIFLKKKSTLVRRGRRKQAGRWLLSPGSPLPLQRPGAFAIYLEPWHFDIFEFLDLKKNTGKEEQRARDLFYALWIPDLFMKRVETNQVGA